MVIDKIIETRKVSEIDRQDVPAQVELCDPVYDLLKSRYIVARLINYQCASV